MWLKLTWESGEPLRLNSDLVEAYQRTEKGGTILSVSDGGYEVKETMEEIDKMLRGDWK